jgi:hypothetical protein
MLFLVTTLITIARVIEGMLSWLIRRRLLAEIFRWRDRKVRWTFSNEGFRVHAADKDRDVPWHAVRRLVPDCDFWFLGIQDGPDLILPIENLGHEEKEFIRAKAAIDQQVGPRFTEPTTPRATLQEGIRQQPTRKTPLGRFLFVLFSIGGTIFLLQERHLAGPNPSLEKFVLIGALALGASFALALLVMRAFKPAKRRAQRAKRDRL